MYVYLSTTLDTITTLEYEIRFADWWVAKMNDITFTTIYKDAYLSKLFYSLDPYLS